MTETQPRPWSSEYRGNETIIKDALGNEIGKFYDHRAADMCLEGVNESELIDTLKRKIADKDEIIDNLADKLDAAEKDVERIREEMR